MNVGRLSALAAWLPLPAAGLLWASSRMSWATVHSADGLTEPRADSLSGALYSPVPAALAIVLVASVAALLAVRGWAVAVVAALVGIVGMATGVQAANVLITGIDAQRAADALELPGRADVDAIDLTPAGPLVALLGALLAIAAALAVIATRSRRLGLSDRFERPGQRTGDHAKHQPDTGYSPPTESDSPSDSATTNLSPDSGRKDRRQDRSARDETNVDRESASPSERDLWEALDAGEDPTT